MSKRFKEPHQVEGNITLDAHNMESFFKQFKENAQVRITYQLTEEDAKKWRQFQLKALFAEEVIRETALSLQQMRGEEEGTPMFGEQQLTWILELIKDCELK